MYKSNIILIGMPGAGKSTVGVILAKRIARRFVDTDLLIQTREGRSLQSILDEHGYMELRRIEENVLLSLDCVDCVVSTGGSAAYSELAMIHLKKNGIVVFLRVDFEMVVQRVKDFDTRGVARSPGQSFEELYHERQILYNRYADIRIECGDMDQDSVTTTICEKLNL